MLPFDPRTKRTPVRSESAHKPVTLTLEPLEDRIVPADLTETFTRSFGTDRAIPDGPGGAAVGWDVDARALPAGAVVTSVVVRQKIDHTRVSDVQAKLTDDTGTTWALRTNEPSLLWWIDQTRTDKTVFDGRPAGQVWHYSVRDTVAGTAGTLTQFDLTIKYAYPNPKSLKLKDTSLSTATARDGQTVTLGYRIANDGMAQPVTLNASLSGPNGVVLSDAYGATTVTAAPGTNWYYRTFRVNLPPGGAPGAFTVKWAPTPAQGSADTVTRSKALTVQAPVAVRVPILMYHHIDYGPDNEGTTPEVLRADIQAMKAYGYTFLTVSELLDIRAGLVAAPAKPVLLTFDDAYNDFYTAAFPILREQNVKATLFAFTEGVQYDRANIMSWDDLRAVQASGLVDVEGHSVSHPHLTQLTDDQLRSELVDSKKLLEQNLGKEIRVLAYPFGDFNARVEKATWAAGYALAVNARGGIEGTLANKFELSRIGIVRGTSTAYDPTRPDDYLFNQLQHPVGVPALRVGAVTVLDAATGRPLAGTAQPGQTLIFRLAVTNTGPTATITAALWLDTDKVPGNGVAYNSTAARSDVTTTVASGQTGTIEFRWTVPVGAVPGTYFADVQLLAALPFGFVDSGFAPALTL